jgi:TRAP-type transport system small permease protein
VPRVIAGIRRLNLYMHYVAGVALLAIFLLTVADITGRSAFNSPVRGTIEVTSLILVVLVFLGLAHSEDLGDHVTVDLIYVRLGERTKKVVDVFVDLLSIVVLGLLAYRLYQFGFRQIASGAHTPVLRWPVWPFVFVASFGTLLYTASTLMKLILRFKGLPVEAHDPAATEGGGREI